MAFGQDDDPPPPRHGPYNSPADRYAQLPRSTRQWLERKNENDFRQLDAAIRFYSTMMAVGKFNAWLIGIIVGTFIATISFGEAIAKMFGWFRH